MEAWRRKAFQGAGVAEVTNKQVATVDQPTTGSGNEPGGGNEELSTLRLRSQPGCSTHEQLGGDGVTHGA